MSAMPGPANERRRAAVQLSDRRRHIHAGGRSQPKRIGWHPWNPTGSPRGRTSRRVENHELIKKPKVEVDVAPVGLVENAEEVKKPKVEEENAEDVKTPGKLEEVAPINFRETFTVEMARIQFKKEPGNSYNAFIADVLNGSTTSGGRVRHYIQMFVDKKVFRVTTERDGTDTYYFDSSYDAFKHL
eukprot:jgi/Mesvir1/3534/Mv12005-RA.1